MLDKESLIASNYQRVDLNTQCLTRLNYFGLADGWVKLKILLLGWYANSMQKKADK